MKYEAVVDLTEASPDQPGLHADDAALVGLARTSSTGVLGRYAARLVSYLGSMGSGTHQRAQPDDVGGCFRSRAIKC